MAASAILIENQFISTKKSRSKMLECKSHYYNMLCRSLISQILKLVFHYLAPQHDITQPEDYFSMCKQAKVTFNF